MTIDIVTPPRFLANAEDYHIERQQTRVCRYWLRCWFLFSADTLAAVACLLDVLLPYAAPVCVGLTLLLFCSAVELSVMHLYRVLLFPRKVTISQQRITICRPVGITSFCISQLRWFCGDSKQDSFGAILPLRKSVVILLPAERQIVPTLNESEFSRLRLQLITLGVTKLKDLTSREEQIRCRRLSPDVVLPLTFGSLAIGVCIAEVCARPLYQCLFFNTAAGFCAGALVSVSVKWWERRPITSKCVHGGLVVLRCTVLAWIAVLFCGVGVISSVLATFAHATVCTVVVHFKYSKSRADVDMLTATTPLHLAQHGSKGSGLIDE